MKDFRFVGNGVVGGAVDERSIVLPQQMLKGETDGGAAAMMELFCGSVMSCLGKGE